MKDKTQVAMAAIAGAIVPIMICIAALIIEPSKRDAFAYTATLVYFVGLSFLAVFFIREKE